MTANQQIQPFDKFLLWEAASRDTIDFKKIYVDMAGDLNAGLMLSEILYWYLPSKTDGEHKLRVEHDEFMWIACRRYEWFERCRLSPDKADAALRVLVNEGLIIKKVYKFAGSPTIHVRINTASFMQRWSHLLNNPPLNPYLSEIEIGKNQKTISEKTAKRNAKKSENDFGKNGNSLTEITPETPAWITTWDGETVTLPAYIAAIIHAWAISWPGKPSGKPYANQTYRDDAEAMLKRQISPANVQEFCNQLRENRFKTSRAAFGIIVNDIDSWLAFNRLPRPGAGNGQGEKTAPKTKVNPAYVNFNIERERQGLSRVTLAEYDQMIKESGNG